MRNVNLRIRCISEEALESLIELLREESNGVFVESWSTAELPRADDAEIIYGSADRLPSKLGSSRHSSALRRSRA